MLNHINIKLVDSVTCPKNWSWESKRNGWNGYHIWYVMGGGALIKTEQKEYHLIPGDCFLFDLNKNHYCTHNAENPLQVASIYFHANELSTSAIPQKLIRGNILLGEMVSRCIQLYPQNPLFAENYLKTVLVEFLAEETSEKTYSAPVTLVNNILEENKKRMLSLEEMSLITGYSKNQIIRLFRMDTGMTPIQFQMHQKMTFAAQMLLYSDKSITEITDEIGMDDPNYFSKTFKKYIGKSPRNYRLYMKDK